jgi:hypothetical protein
MHPLLELKPLANARLDIINNELAAEFTSSRQADSKQVTTIISPLRALRPIWACCGMGSD